MPLNSPKCPPYWNSTSGFDFAPQSTCRVCEILSKSDHPRQKKMPSCRFSSWRNSAILDFRGPIMGSLKSRCTISYRSSIDTIALNCLVFLEIRFFCILATDEQMDSKIVCASYVVFVKLAKSQYFLACPVHACMCSVLVHALAC